MHIFDSLLISASGLTAERLRLDLVANNLANISTTRTGPGEVPKPYKRKIAVFKEILKEAAVGQQSFRGRGVQVTQILEDRSPAKLVYEPEHPDADSRGYVHYPNVNVVREMTDMLTATRAYEANVTVLNAAKNMALKALQIGRA